MNNSPARGGNGCLVNSLGVCSNMVPGDSQQSYGGSVSNALVGQSYGGSGSNVLIRRSNEDDEDYDNIDDYNDDDYNDDDYNDDDCGDSIDDSDEDDDSLMKAPTATIRATRDSSLRTTRKSSFLAFKWHGQNV